MALTKILYSGKLEVSIIFDLMGYAQALMYLCKTNLEKYYSESVN